MLEGIVAGIPAGIAAGQLWSTNGQSVAQLMGSVVRVEARNVQVRKSNISMIRDARISLQTLYTTEQNKNPRRPRSSEI